MSRIGKKPIAVPSGVEVKIDGHHITVKGPKEPWKKISARNSPSRWKMARSWSPVPTMRTR